MLSGGQVAKLSGQFTIIFIDFNTELIYDQYGNIIKESKVEGTDFKKILTVMDYSYQYDSHGNWISKTTKKNDVIQSKTSREISYWED